MLQPEFSKPLQVPSVAARLIGSEKSPHTFFIGKPKDDNSFRARRTLEYHGPENIY